MFWSVVPILCHQDLWVMYARENSFFGTVITYSSYYYLYDRSSFVIQNLNNAVSCYQVNLPSLDPTKAIKGRVISEGILILVPFYPISIYWRHCDT